MRIKTIKCNKNNYNSKFKRPYNRIKAIVIHNTGNVGDSAENNGNFFKNNDLNDYKRSAHFFIDREGNIVRSVYIKYIAYSVKDINPTMYNNANTVSIELCDIADKDISEKQLKALKWLIKKIKKKVGDVPIIRHYDVNGKQCPLRYITPTKWEALRKELL